MSSPETELVIDNLCVNDYGEMVFNRQKVRLAQTFSGGNARLMEDITSMITQSLSNIFCDCVVPPNTCCLRSMTDLKDMVKGFRLITTCPATSVSESSPRCA